MLIDDIRAHMRQGAIDARLLADFRGSNAVLNRLLGGARRHLTRRAMLLIPARAEPVLLAHGLDAGSFNGASIGPDLLCQERYLGWRDLHQWIQSRVGAFDRIAMEYTPGNALPVIGQVDAGTVELVRALAGVEVVSSANLVQVAAARWGAPALQAHLDASVRVDEVKNEAFALIGHSLRQGRTIHEHEVAAFIQQRFGERGLEFPDGPIVGVNAHAGDPHYGPSAERPTPIRPGDWILIDLWARLPGDHNIHSDVTWTGFAGREPSREHRRVFDLVLAARDAALARAQAAFRAAETVQGWQLDDAAREVFLRAEMGEHIRHRTGHSLSPGPLVHGVGMNLDNLETHDTRAMLPDTGFTIEPGLYLPDFGVRSEINVYVDPARGPIVTCPVQREIILV